MIKKILILISVVSMTLFSYGIYLYNTDLLLLKYYLGAASTLGKPVTAKVYTDNKLIDSIKLYCIYKKNNPKEIQYWLLDFGFTKTKTGREIIWIDNVIKEIGTPVNTSIQSYGYKGNEFLQDESGGKFVPYNSVKYDYKNDMELKISFGEISFKIPPEEKHFKCDSIRIVF